MYSIYLAEVKPSREVLTAERQIIAEEGYLTINGTQYSTFSDADIARRREAEYRVRKAECLARLAATCAWCGDVIGCDEATIELGGRRVHADSCAAEFDEFSYGEVAEQEFADMEARAAA